MYDKLNEARFVLVDNNDPLKMLMRSDSEKASDKLSSAILEDIGKMSKTKQEIMRLKIHEDLTPKEIAERLGLNNNSVWQRVYEIKQTILENIKNDPKRYIL